MTESNKKSNFQLLIFNFQLILLCLFAFVMPFSTPNFPYFNMAPSVIALMLLLWLIQGNFSHKFNALKTNKLLLPFIFCTGLYVLYVLGLLYSENLVFGLKDLLLKLPLLLFPFIIFTINSDNWSKKNTQRILQFFVLGNMVTLIISVVHSWTFFRKDAWFYHFHYEEASWFHHPSYASMYYCFSFAIIIYLFLHNKTKLWEKTIGGIGIILFSIEIILLDSRAGIVTFVSILLFYLFYILFFKRKLIPHLLASIVFLSGVFLLSYKLLPPEMNRIQSTISKIQENSKQPREKDVRLLIWNASFKVGMDNIPFGVGTGDIKKELKKQYEKEEYIVPYEENYNAHNQYLQIFVTLGMAGIIFFLSMMFLIFWIGYKAKNILFILLGIIIGINFAVESMLEKQAGIMFFSFFFVLLYFVSKINTETEKRIILPPLVDFIRSMSKHRIIFLFAVTLYVLGIPFSRFLMSLGGIILVINWFLERNIEQKFKNFFQSKIALNCLIIYFVHLLWLISSENLQYGLEDLWIKIPLFFIPIIFYTSEPLSRKEYQNILILYVLGVFISSFSGFVTYLVGNLADKREMALFISYLRFEINICFVCFVCLYLFFKSEITTNQKIIIAISLCWFLFFLLYSGSITAIVLFFIVGIIIAVKMAIQNNNKFFRYIVPSLFAVVLLCASIVIYYTVKQYFTANFSIETAAKYTPDGNPYFHNPQKAYIENGSYIFTYISDIELEEAWNKRSNINFNDYTQNGFSVKITLIRYLNSMGLHKDRLGVEALSEKDIYNIEQGIANVSYTHKLNIINRMYSVLWEFSEYYHTGNIRGYTIPQRIELWKYSIQTIKKYPIFGVGTGDVKDVFAQELELGNSSLAGTNMRSHNQYFTLAIAFGIVGLLLILFSIFYPAFALKKFRNPLFLAFFCIVIFSMFTEDTLEPQDGATFFAFFYSFFLFLFPKEKL